jgi:hypothetical protein
MVDFLLAQQVLNRISLESGAFTLTALDRPQENRGEGGWTPELVAVLAPHPSGPPVSLAIAVRSRINPAEAMPLTARMAGAKTTPVLFCPAVSPRVAEICRDRGVGFLDEAGNCRISAPGLFLYVTGKGNARPDTRPAVDVFAPRSSRLIRLLLTEPARGWQVQELAREAIVSLGLASKVKQTLVEEAFVVEQARRLLVPDPTRLLREWSEHYAPARTGESHFEIGGPLFDAERRLADACKGLNVPYALTQFSGAFRITDSVRLRRATIYLEDRVEEVLSSLKWPRVERGGKVTIWRPYDVSVFWGTRQVDGMTVVSPLQLYLDLVAAGEEGHAAAETILRKELGSIVRQGRRNPR